MKHRTISASPCALKRQRLRDRLNRQAKPTSYNPTDELCTFSAAVGADSLPSLVRASAAVRRLTTLPSPYGPCGAHRGQGEGALSFDIHQNLDFPTQNQFPKLNLIALSEVAQASGQSGADLPVKGQPGSGLPASSTRPSTLNPEFSQPIHPRSACSAYPFEKNAETTAETPLRFTETSQQTLRQISLLPITYNNFAEKNALKSNLLRLLRHTTIVDSIFSLQLSILNWVSAEKHVRSDKNTRKNTRSNTLKRPKNTQNTKKTRSFFYERRNVNSRTAALAAHSSPGGEDQGEGVRSLCSIEPILQIKNHLIIDHKCHSTAEGVRSFDTRQILDFPTQNTFPKLNLIAVSEVAQASCLPVQRLPASSTPPSTLNPEFSQPIHPCSARSACSAHPCEKISSLMRRLLKEEGIENAHAGLEGVGDAQGVIFGFFGFWAGEQFVHGGAEEGDPAFEVFLFQGQDHVFGHGLAFKGHGAEEKGAPERIHGGQMLGPIDLRQVIEDGAQQRVGVHFVVKAVDQIFNILFCGDILHRISK
jgi:hypothetical protein